MQRDDPVGALGSALVGLVLTIACAGGCTARALVPSEADAFRDRIRSLEAQVASLEASNTELRANIAAADAISTGAIPADVAAETPRAVQLAIGWGSSIDVDASDPARGLMTLYLEPRDARGRFTQVAGTLSVSVMTIPSPGQGDPIRLGERTLTPRGLRDAWRSGLLGTHYTVVVPLDLSQVKDAPPAAVAIELREGAGAPPLRATAVIELTGGNAAVPARTR